MGFFPVRSRAEVRHERHAQLGDTFRIFAPGRGSHTWVFNHPDVARRILITNHRNYTKGVGFDRIKILLGNGIIVSEGEFWKRQRRLLQPTFHRRVLTQLGGIITRANARALVDEWIAVQGAWHPVGWRPEIAPCSSKRSSGGPSAARTASASTSPPRWSASRPNTRPAFQPVT